MIQEIDFSVVEDVGFNGDIVDVIELNGVTIWDRSALNTATAGLIFSPSDETSFKYYVTSNTVYAEADAITYYDYDFNTNNFVEQTLAEGDSVVGLYQARTSTYPYYGVLDYVGTATDVIIPNQINGNIIKTIGSSAFVNTSVESVKWGEDMQYIYHNAFNNTPIYNNSANWENGCLRVNNAYVAANSTTITIPEDIEILGVNMCYSLDFSASGLTVYYNSDKIKNLSSSGAFSSNVKESDSLPLSTITFGSNITRIPSYLFISGHRATSSDYKNKTFSISELPNNITTLEPYSLYSSYYMSIFESPFVIPESVVNVGENACPMVVDKLVVRCPKLSYKMFYTSEGRTNIGDITIGSTCLEIGALAFTERTPKSVTFEHPAGASISLPQAGSSTGMFYYKSARAITIYTDNETIKNYDWATDNVTATILHLDGSAWA